MSDLNALLGALRSQQNRVNGLEKSVQEMAALLRQVSDAPKWIEEIPGARRPYFATIDITIAANSTSKVEGTYTVSTDGPFACVGMALFYQRTSAPYSGQWGPATTLEVKMAAATQQNGFAYCFDTPVVGSFDVEISESGSDRNWQNSAFASALFAPSMGGAYIMPCTNLCGRNSVITVRVTPTVALAVAGKVQAILLGYKIIQADNYQP